MPDRLPRRLCLVNLYLEDLLAARIGGHPGENEGDGLPSPLVEALVTLGIARIESLAQAGELPDNY